MYLTNKYTRWYNHIIDNAQTRESIGYTEKHHIIPKCLGGNNSAENLITLSAREHFVCHLLLTKMVTGTDKAKMINAAWLMACIKNKNQNRYVVWETIVRKN